MNGDNGNIVYRTDKIEDYVNEQFQFGSKEESAAVNRK